MQSPQQNVTAPQAFPPDGRRLIIYVVYDRRGEIDGFIPHALSALREHATHILVVVNGLLTREGRARLAPVADTILVRENEGFDITAHRDALDFLGDDVADFDEIVMTNDTWYGPVRPFGPMFERVDSEAIHFWGITDHPEESPNPFTGSGVLLRHLQSFWIAVRREMFLSDAWREYWSVLPELETYFDAVLRHEVVFTDHFTSRGYVDEVLFAWQDYPTGNPSLFNADLLLRDGCPILKRRPFFHFPPYLDRHAVVGRQTLDQVASYGFPVSLILENLARTVPPRTLNADAGLLEILDDTSAHDSSDDYPSLLVHAHVDDMEAAPELLRRIALIPQRFDLVLTTSDGEAAAELPPLIESMEGIDGYDLRVLPSSSGRHVSALLIGCKDLLRSETHELVLTVHARTPHGDDHNEQRYLLRHQVENLLGSTASISNLIRLFRHEQGLGLVFPATAHIGQPTLGRGWDVDAVRVTRILRALEIRVPMDDVTPLAPSGGMFVARIAALRLLTEMDWGYRQYARQGDYGEGSLARAQELVVPYAAGELGFHTRTILHSLYAGISHTMLEYKLDQTSSTTDGYPVDQIQFLHKAGRTGRGGIVALSRMYMRLHWPQTATALLPAYHFAARLVRKASALRASSRQDSLGRYDPATSSRE